MFVPKSISPVLDLKIKTENSRTKQRRKISAETFLSFILHVCTMYMEALFYAHSIDFGMFVIVEQLQFDL